MSTSAVSRTRSASLPRDSAGDSATPTERVLLELVQRCGQSLLNAALADGSLTPEEPLTAEQQSALGRSAIVAAFDLLLTALAEQRRLTLPHWNGGDWHREIPITFRLTEADRQTSYRAASERVRESADLFAAFPSEGFGDLYEFLLDFAPQLTGGRFTLEPRFGNRRSLGTYYTPPAFIACLLDHTLTPLFEEIAERPPEHQAAALLAVRVCDPACGGGRFLLAAGRRLACELVRVSESDESTVFRHVAENCLYGVDLDPIAIALCRLALWWEAARPQQSAALSPLIRCGDGLLGVTAERVADGIPHLFYQPRGHDSPFVCQTLRTRNRHEVRRSQRPARTLPTQPLPAEYLRFAADLWCAAALWEKSETALGALCPTTADLQRVCEQGPTALLPEQLTELRRLAEEARFLHWPFTFPEIFEPQSDRPPGFDAVIGNPPFANAIDGGIDDRRKTLASVLQPELGGTADLAFRFLAQATKLIRPGGFIGMVQPRAALNAPSLAKFRKRQTPRLLFASSDSDAFRGAAVYVSLIVLGPPGPCRVGFASAPEAAGWQLRSHIAANWWSEIASASSDIRQVQHHHRTATLAAEFEVVGSMTTGEAYDAVPWIGDESPAGRESFRFVTTGLIDPDRCLWGKQPCRYLGRTLQQPRFIVQGDRFAKRIAFARRPKLLVAGLSARVECFLDEAGEFLGAVSTYTITHPEDDRERLRELCAELLSDAATARFRAELGGNALGGGNITMRKSFLQEFPWPQPSAP